MYLQKRKLFLKRFVIFVILSSFLCIFVFFLNFIFTRLSWTLDLYRNPWQLILLTAFAATILYKPFDYLVLVLFRHVFFRKKMARLQALKNASKTLLHVLDLKELSNLMVNTLAEILRQRIAVLVLWDPVRKSFWVASCSGLAIMALNKIRFEEKDPMVRFLKERKGLVEREKCLREFSWPEVYEISKGFELLGAQALISIFWEENWMGFLSLSGKKGGAPFSSDEVRAIEDFAESAGFALRSAVHVDELKQMNEKLKDLQSRLLQTTKLAAIEQLAAGIAHEIHNPLTIISGKAQILLLKKNKQLDEKTLDQTLKTIVKQTKRAADITRKLLMFSEPTSSGKDVIEFESVVDDTLALISYQTTLDEITIRKSISKNIPPFTGEINEIREVFLNLILNAVQAVERKGMIHIQIRYLERDGFVEIKIQDTGKGIPAETIPRLFNPFFSTREGGLGLGLFITQQIVHRYQGSIHVESEPGKGTVVVIHLPERTASWGGDPVPAEPQETKVES